MLWDSWIAMGLVSAAAWGLSCVFDVCFVEECVYREPLDGSLVAGLFCILPLFVMGGGDVALDIDAVVVAVALLAGICYLLHIYFYFKALFLLNDASNAEIFNNLSVLLVPLLAFILLGEVLDPLHYVAIGLSLAGVVVLIRFQLSTLTWVVSGFLGISVLFISLVMVMQAWVLRLVSYEAAVFLFSSAALLGAIFLLVAVTRLRRRVFRLCKRFGLLFAGVQVLELVALLGSQRATDIGPSVSLVALLGCTLPLFVMTFSWVFLRICTQWPVSNRSGVRSALLSQTDAYPAKILSMLLIVAAIGLIRL